MTVSADAPATRILVAPARFGDGDGDGDGERLAGGWVRFAAVRLTVDGAARIVPLGEVRTAIAPLPAEDRGRVHALCDALAAPRTDIAGLVLDRPHVMGVLNLTPDSFSDGGQFARGGGIDPVAAARAMVEAGASLIDIGGESTRPGATEVPADEELARVMPVLTALPPSRLREGPGVGASPRTEAIRPFPTPGPAAPSLAPPASGRGWVTSIDTRKAAVMAAALDAGASIVNDVSALTFDPAALPLVAARGCPVVLMHAQGRPETMQAAPRYADVVAEVFAWLEARIAACVAAGVDRARILADPGIGFGKTAAHNAALLRGLATFHALGVPLVLGASRKALIARLAGDASAPADRLGGSVALALHGVANGVQFVRVHDVAATVQAVRLWQAVR